MAINSRYDAVVLDLIESASRNVKALPVNLGGVSGAYGGVGGPPGGFIGRLPQTRVAYDESELGTDYTPSSGMSLLDNLNHIRYRLDIIESGGSGSPLTVEEYGGTPSVPNVSTIVFQGAVDVVDDGGNQVTVLIAASGGGGISDAPSDGNVYGRKDASWINTDTRYLLLDASNSPLTGRLLIYDLPDGTDASYFASNGDASPVYMEQYTNTDNVSVPTLGMYRTTSGVGNIISPMIEGYQDSSGAGAITGDFIYLEDSDSGAFFGVDKDGNVNIPSGMFYNINGTPHTHSGYMLASNNLSDLTNAGTARTNLGLVAGGAGDIWVEKAGDTMTGSLTMSNNGKIYTFGLMDYTGGLIAQAGRTGGYAEEWNDALGARRGYIQVWNSSYLVLGATSVLKLTTAAGQYVEVSDDLRVLGNFQVNADVKIGLYAYATSGVPLTTGKGVKQWAYGWNGSDGSTEKTISNIFLTKDDHTSGNGTLNFVIAASESTSAIKLKLNQNGNLTVLSSTADALVLGAGTAGIDYILKFDGETNDGILTWMEDEDYFKFSDDIFIADGENIVLDTTTGTKIGTATSQKLSLWNATPIVQPTTGIAEASFTENSGGTVVNVDSTFDGYTLQQVVKALRNIGILQ